MEQFLGVSGTSSDMDLLPDHGTVARYRLKCRCTPCRAAKSAEHRAYAESKGQPSREDRAAAEVARQAALIENVTFLLETGETHPEAVARRVGSKTPGGLERTLHRLGRTDLWNRMTIPAREESWDAGAHRMARA